MSAGTKTRGKVNPSRLKLYIGGAPFAPAYALEWRDGTLKYRARSERGKESEQELTPPAEQWERFWAALAGAGVWSWEAKYIDPRINDGTWWSVAIEHEGRSITSRGENAYPEGFSAFLEAVRGLLGGLTFK
jgi:hypothetical protein